MRPKRGGRSRRSQASPLLASGSGPEAMEAPLLRPMPPDWPTEGLPAFVPALAGTLLVVSEECEGVGDEGEDGDDGDEEEPAWAAGVAYDAPEP